MLDAAVQIAVPAVLGDHRMTFRLFCHGHGTGAFREGQGGVEGDVALHTQDAGEPIGAVWIHGQVIPVQRAGDLMGLAVIAHRNGWGEQRHRLAGRMDGEEGEAQGGFQGLGAEGGQGDLAVLNGQVSDSAGHGGKVTPCSRCGLEQQSALSAHLTGEGFIGLAALHEAVHRRNGQISGIVKILIQLLQPLLQRLVLQAAGDETLFRDLSQGQRPVRLRCAGSHCLKALHGHGEHAVLHLTVLEPVGGLRFGGGDEHQLAAGQGGAGTGFDGQGAQGAWDKSGF